jgi:predicted flap endonuclease-1-like 5' DNA nuclease
VREAHRLAEEDERERFKGDPKWEEMRREINLAFPEDLAAVPGIGRVLAERICRHRPYRRMRDLLRVPGIGPVRLRRLSERFWCIGVLRTGNGWI